MGIRVGIDLGTTFSAVAKINQVSGKPEIIKNSFGSSITPSVLCFEADGSVLFGEDAKNMQAIGNTNVAAFFKRSMGNDSYRVEFWGNTYSAADLSGILLGKLVEEAEQSCGEKIDSAVITVPAYFTHKERQATIEAGKKAGLQVLSIINEPTAAAFSYGLIEKEKEQTVLIYDLGGGTFDVTIARICRQEIQILGSDGNHELGGKDFDDCIARYLAQEFYEKYDVDLSEDDEAAASLLVTAERVKKQLTSKDQVRVPVIYRDIRAEIPVTEAVFEEISGFLLGATKELTENLIVSVALTWDKITGVVLAGGSTRMRMVADYVKEMSGKEPLSGIHVDEAVALGAAIKANIDESGNPVGYGFLGVLGAKAVSDVTAHALGMIAVSEDGQRYFNSVMIPKNTTIPAESRKTYSFRTKAQGNELEVYVLQGAYERPQDNMILHKYMITGIEKTAQNPSLIEVAYNYNANGVVDVSAVQKETGKSLPVRIEPVPEDMSWTDGSPADQLSQMQMETKIMLAVDLSGSMRGQPLEQAQAAIEAFVEQMDSSHTKIGLLVFADSTRVAAGITDEYDRLIREIGKMNVGDVGFGNQAQPFTASCDILTKKFLRGHKDTRSYIIVLTDGMWNNPDAAVREAERCHEQDIEVIALGFGSADYDFLKKIASIEEFASLTSLSDLSGSFSKIAQTIGEGRTGSGIRLM